MAAPGYAALLLLAALVLATAAFAADPADPRIRSNPSDEQAASAALLTRAELGPGWRGGERRPFSMKAPVCPALRPSFADLVQTGHAESVFDNGNGGVQVASDVQVMRSPDHVRKLFERILQPALTRCIGYDIAKSLGGTGIRVLTTKREMFPKSGDLTALYKTLIAVKSGSDNVTVFNDSLFLAKGRTIFWVNIVYPGTLAEMVGKLERRIAKRLVARAAPI
jgi:hypothetical protein